MYSNSSAQSTLKLGILLSGRGSNFLAIAESIRAGRLKGAGRREAIPALFRC